MIKVELCKYIKEQMAGAEKEINELKLSFYHAAPMDFDRIKINVSCFEGQYFALDRISRRLENNVFESTMSEMKKETNNE